MKAKYDGKCPRCRSPFYQGDEIISEGKRWYPVDCRGCAKREHDLTLLLYHNAGVFGPTNPSGEYIHIYLHAGFEVGSAHESWGEEWRAELPYIPYHWHSTTGWRQGSSDGCMKFRDESLMQLLAKIEHFLLWYQKDRSKISQR